MKTLVYGIGALGTVFATLLKKKGHTVCAIDTDDVVATVSEGMLVVTGIWGEHRALLDEAVSSIEDLKQRDFDLIIVTVKAYNTAEVCRDLLPVMGEDTIVILAQNGYGNYDEAVQFIPVEQLALARVIFGAETLATGFSKVSVEADPVVIGSPDNRVAMEKLQRFAELLSDAGIETEVTDEIMKYLWGKIIYNCALNPLGAILEVPYGFLVKEDESKLIVDDIIKEIFQVLAAMEEETFWPDAEAYFQEFYSKLILKTSDHHSSMLQDMNRGRKTEIEYLNGAIVRLGKQYDIDTPANEMMRTMVHRKEQLKAIGS